MTGHAARLKRYNKRRLEHSYNEHLFLEEEEEKNSLMRFPKRSTF